MRERNLKKGKAVPEGGLCREYKESGLFGIFLFARKTEYAQGRTQRFAVWFFTLLDEIGPLAHQQTGNTSVFVGKNIKWSVPYSILNNFLPLLAKKPQNSS